jgi:hypothetical protein
MNPSQLAKRFRQCIEPLPAMIAPPPLKTCRKPWHKNAFKTPKKAVLNPFWCKVAQNYPFSTAN